MWPNDPPLLRLSDVYASTGMCDAVFATVTAMGFLGLTNTGIAMLLVLEKTKGVFQSLVRILAVVLMLAPLARASGVERSDEELGRVLASRIRTERVLQRAEENCAALLAQYSNYPTTVAWIYTTMGLRYYYGPGRNLDKAIEQLELALHRYGEPSPKRAFETCELLGDALQAKTKNAAFRDVPLLRRRALGAFLEGLERALSQERPIAVSTTPSERARWVERFKGSIEYLYADDPSEEEIETEAKTYFTNSAIARELIGRVRKARPRRQIVPGGSPPFSEPPGFNPPPGSLNLSAREYELQGSLVQFVLLRRDTISGISQAEFRVAVNNCMWFIEVTNRNPDGSILSVQQAGCNNGTEIFEISYPISPASTTRTNIQAVQSPRGSGFAVATVQSNNVPVDYTGMSLVGHLWLMFASGCHFKGLTTNQLTPVYEFAASVLGNRDLKVDADWELIGGPGSLPLKIVYYNPGGYYYWNRAQISF